MNSIWIVTCGGYFFKLDATQDNLEKYKHQIVPVENYKKYNLY